MRAVIQRVTSASVTVDRTEVSRIGRGLCVLIGLGTDDTTKEMDYIISKILSLRLFPGPSAPSSDSPAPKAKTEGALDRRTEMIRTSGSATPDDLGHPSLLVPQGSSSQPMDHEPPKEWRQTVREINGEILIVSQFTLLAKTKKGNKPDFHNAMKTDLSKALYVELIKSMRSKYSDELIQEGRFGAMMEVQISNDGPVTIILDTNDK